jgi:nitrate/nitrite transport system permease protein
MSLLTTDPAALSATIDLTAPVAPDLPKASGRLRTAGTAVGWGLVGVLVFLAIWQFGASRVPTLPTPAETFSELRTMLADPFRDGGPNDKGIGIRMASSLGRVAQGFLIATVIGVPFGLAIGASERAWKAANPIIQFLRPVSPLAWFPIWLVVFRDAPRAAVWVIFITALWPIVINTAAGAASVPRDHRNVAKVFQLSMPAYVRHVLIPHSLPSVITGLRISMGTAWMVIVAVEMLSGGVGIGTFVWEEYNALNLARMAAAIVLIGAVGLVLDLAFLRLGKSVALEGSHE